MFGCDLAREFDGETVRVVQREHVLAGKCGAASGAIQQIVEHRHAALQCAIEGLLFRAQRVLDA